MSTKTLPPQFQLNTQLNNKIGSSETRSRMYGGYRRRFYKKSFLGIKFFYDLLNKSGFFAKGRDFDRREKLFHQWGAGIEFFGQTLGIIRANASFAKTNSFAIKNILVNSRVSDGFDVEAGRPFMLCKKTCNIFVTYQWFNRVRHEDYRAVGVKLDLDLYKGINMKISYKKGLGITPVTTDNHSIFMNITLNTDRLFGIPSQSRDIVEGIDEKIFSPPAYRYAPLKIEGYAVRMRHQRR